MKRFYLVAMIVLLVGLAGWLWPRSPASIDLPRSQSGAPVVRQSAPPLANLPAAQTGAHEPEIKRVPLLPLNQNRAAWDSLADARWNGDDRTPPIERSLDSAARPDAAQLADPKAYAAFEANQNRRVYLAFYQAAQQAIPKLQADIERGRQAGITPEEIARAEEKVRRIVAEQAKLLQQHPELEALVKANPASVAVPRVVAK